MPPGGPPFSFTPGWGPALYWVVPAPSPGSPLYSWAPHSIPRCSSLCPGGPRSHRSSPLPFCGFLTLSRWSHPLFLFSLSLLQGSLLASRALHFPRGPHSVLGCPCSFPGAPILYSLWSCSLPGGCVLPRGALSSLPGGLTLYSRVSAICPGGSVPPPGSLQSLPGGPVRCSRDPAVPQGPRSPFGGQSAPLRCGSLSPPGRGRGVPPHPRGCGGGAGRCRCRWRGGAAAPSAIKRAAAPVPQRGRGSP